MKKIDENLDLCPKCEYENTNHCRQMNITRPMSRCDCFLNKLPMDGKLRSQNSSMPEEDKEMGVCWRCQNENTSDCPYPNKADSFAGCGKFLNSLPMEEKPRGLNSLMTGNLIDEGPELRMTEDKVKIHQEICQELSGIYAYKHKNYGASFTSTREKYPNAILIRLHDKFSRLETLLLNDENPKEESIEDTLTDLANYCIMELVERRIEKEEE